MSSRHACRLTLARCALVSALLSIGILLAVSLCAAPPKAQCPDGKIVSADTAGQCCWPQQAWSNMRKACVGTPQCPAGLQQKGEECACGAGQEISEDTAGQCCWPGQAWSMSRKQCVGVPSCAPGWKVEKETCVAGTSEANSAPQAASPPQEPMPLPPPAPTPGDAEPMVSVASPATPIEGASGVTINPVKKRFRIGLIIGGASMLAAGYGISIVMGIAAGSQLGNAAKAPCFAQMVTFNYVPVVGAALGAITQIGRQAGGTTSSSAPECHERPDFLPIGVIAIVSTALQVVGVVGIAVGFKRVPVDPVAGIGAPEGVQLSVLAGAPGSLLGLTLKLTNW